MVQFFALVGWVKNKKKKNLMLIFLIKNQLNHPEYILVNKLYLNSNLCLSNVFW